MRASTLSLLALTAACRFEPYAPVAKQPAHPGTASEVFSSALETAREHGYRSTEVDEMRHFATFVARSGHYTVQALTMDGTTIVGANQNHLMIHVADDGAVKAWATGPDVRGDRIDGDLRFELEVFASTVAGYRVQVAPRRKR